MRVVVSVTPRIIRLVVKGADSLGYGGKEFLLLPFPLLGSLGNLSHVLLVDISSIKFLDLKDTALTRDVFGN